ncbi:MAG: conjugal transfer protein TraF [Planctomycetes bacterium]|nr:conjugal transfer protein TraF [Planctomycetota bacterium]
MHKPSLSPTSPTLVRLALAGACLFASSRAAALESFIVGPRALGMGGANVASVNDIQAQFYNPAAFGFFHDRERLTAMPAPPPRPDQVPAKDSQVPAGGQTPVAAQAPIAETEYSGGGFWPSDNNHLGRKSWGFGLDASIGLRAHGDVAELLDVLKKLNDNGTFNRLAQNGISSQQDVADALNGVNALSNLAAPTNAISADANGGVGLRIGHFGLGVRAFAEATGRVQDVDFTNLGLGGAGNLSNQVDAQFPTDPGAPQLFTPAQVTQLTNQGLSQNAIDNLDLLARQNGVTADQAQNLTVIIGQANQASAANPINGNQTDIHFYGAGIVELPFTYGYAFDEHFAIGMNLKLMVGDVFVGDIRAQSSGSNTTSTTEKASKRSPNLGVDLAAMYRIPWFNFGLTGRNLNAPSFAGPTLNGRVAPRFRVNPQATAGAAFIPWEVLTVEADCDLNKSTTTFSGYDTQDLRFGAEWNVLHFLALRGGAYRNLAQNDIGWVVTAGVGLDFYAVRTDFAVGAATKKTEFDGRQIPREIRASWQLLVDF